MSGPQPTSSERRRRRLILIRDQFDQPAFHLEEGDLDRVDLARFDQRRSATDEFTHTLLEKGGLVERPLDGLLEALGQVGGSRKAADVAAPIGTRQDAREPDMLAGERAHWQGEGGLPAPFLRDSEGRPRR